jgi:tetratricopeptide (TPR) repeat protein
MAADTRILQQLKHKDPQQRRKAIIALADSRDSNALKPLEEVAKSDPEEKLRGLAERAGKHLKEQLEKAALAPETTARIAVSKNDEEKARGYVDEALSLYIAKDMAKAAKSLTKALKANPNLKEDNYFLSLVGNVFETTGEQGLEMLRSGEKRQEFIESAEKNKVQKHKDKHRAATEEITWASVGFDLVIYGAVVAVITFLAPLVIGQLMTQFKNYLTALPPEKLAQESVKLSPHAIDQLLKTLQGQSIIVSLVTAIGGGIGSVVYMLALGFLIHQLATRLMGGNGTMPHMLSQVVPFYSLITAVYFIWACLVMGMVAIGAGLIGLLCMPIMGLGGLVVFFKTAGRIGQSYDFGAARGCMALMAGTFALGILSSLLAYATVGATLNTMLSTLKF